METENRFKRPSAVVINEVYKPTIKLGKNAQAGVPVRVYQAADGCLYYKLPGGVREMWSGRRSTNT